MPSDIYTLRTASNSLVPDTRSFYVTVTKLHFHLVLLFQSF
jgi:hypothetical protein